MRQTAHRALRATDPAAAGPDARTLARAREQALAGELPDTAPRAVISESWSRMLRLGIDPDRGQDPDLLDTAEVEHRRRETGLAEVLVSLRETLSQIVRDARHVLVVTDAEGRVLWREGSAAMRRQADRLGFDVGACWAEDAVGTNAIGTALAARRPVQVHSAEHFVRTHHAWTCASAPLHDPRSGRLIGLVDLSGPAGSFHPHTIALVSAAARLAEAELRAAHLEALDRLRTVASPVLARMPGPAVVVDRNGWTAAASGLAPSARLLLPRSPGGPRVWLPALGECAVEPLSGGWLVRPCADPADGADPAAERTTVVVELARPGHAELAVDGPSGSWSHALSPRHAELLLLLAVHRQGRTAGQLAADLFGDAGRKVTVRAELSRLRRHLGGLLEHRPYRFAETIQVQVRLPDDLSQLLPYSDAPAVRRLRRELVEGPAEESAAAVLSLRSAAPAPRPSAGG
ncbi:GAF domain-containing protein [Streptacidiphilus griseoplanus]|uniref:GAF domain-containing protein n=1 Tax=Peterkaempfera griseoplana TaxID=66896 RepID=UPI0007C82899|nr:GAF domain-containing protein [Peterkaempfera griseoplana]